MSDNPSEAEPFLGETNATTPQLNNRVHDVLSLLLGRRTGANARRFPDLTAFGVNMTSARMQMPSLDVQIAVDNGENEAQTERTRSPDDATRTAALLLLEEFKYLVPFIILFIFKVFFDRVLDLAIIAVLVSSAKGMRTILDDQAALKSRCSLRALGTAFIQGTITLLLISNAMYTIAHENIWTRLIFLPPSHHRTMHNSLSSNTTSSILPQSNTITSTSLNPNSTPSMDNNKSFLYSLVLTIILDICIVMLTIMVKVIACVIIQSPKISQITNRSPLQTTGVSVIDLEQGSGQHSHVRNTDTDLPMRRRGVDVVSPLNGGIIVNEAGGSATSSDVNVKQTDEAARYVRYLRVSTFIDAISLTHRSICPTPIWFVYYSSGFGGPIFGLCYFTLKVYLSAKRFRAALDVGEVLILGRLEYGHYATAEELRASSPPCECPVCFDPITAEVRPVCLECRHIFCEVCIQEWLGKEKTCPVCRAVVKCETPAVHEVKAKADSILNFPV